MSALIEGYDAPRIRGLQVPKLGPLCSFDTETHLITNLHPVPRMVCFSYATVDPVLSGCLAAIGMPASGVLDAVTGCAFFRLLTTWGVRWVGHNTAYDLAVIAQFADYFERERCEAAAPGHGPMLLLVASLLQAGRVHDTMIREKLLDISRGRLRGFKADDGFWVKLNYGLEDLARRHLKLQLDKDTWRLRYAELDGLPIEQWPREAVDYARIDAEATLGCHLKQDRINASTSEGPYHYAGSLQNEAAQCRKLFGLHLISAHGLRTDPDGIDRLEHHAQHYFDELSAFLQEYGLVRSDGSRDTKAAKDRMVAQCAEQKLPVRITKTADKKLSAGEALKQYEGIALDKDACEATGDLVLEAYSEITSFRTVLSKDVEALRRGQWLPIHTRFDSLLQTGRTSSSKPNVQNPRRLEGVRECFVPRAGYWYLQADFSGLELSTMAEAAKALVGWSALAEAICKGLDAHTDLAATILGISYDECRAWLKRKKTHGKDDPQYLAAYNARQTAKVANFGFPGGLGAERLVIFARKLYRVTLTIEQAKQLKQIWLSKWPEFRTYFDIIGKRVEAGGAIRQLYVDRIRGGATYTEACNTYFQGLGSDVTGESIWDLVAECYGFGPMGDQSPLYGCRIVNYVHDEFILEVPADLAIANAAGRRLLEVMRISSNRLVQHVPITVDEFVIMRYWSKDAAHIEDDHGIVLPWGTPANWEQGLPTAALGGLPKAA
jgi:hypothetical protein